jgi:hypothetical protein
MFALTTNLRLGVRGFVLCLVLAAFFCAGSLAAQEQRKNDDSKQSLAKGGPGKRDWHGPHAGTWLRRYSQVPAEEQERALGNDPDFKALPSAEQQKLRHRLQEFNSYPAEKKQRILRRMELFEHLSPEQQEQARALWDRLRQLPDERRRIVRRTAKNLRQFDVAERERVLATAPYQSSFNDQERALIRDLAGLDIEAAAAQHRSESPKDREP